METLLMNRGFRTGDTVRYVGRYRNDGVNLVPGTLGSVVAGPFPRKLRPDRPHCMAYQVLFGYRTFWMSIDGLEAE